MQTLLTLPDSVWLICMLHSTQFELGTLQRTLNNFTNEGESVHLYHQYFISHINFVDVVASTNILLYIVW